MAEWQRRRYSVITSAGLGRTVIVDTFKRRMWLMRQRLGAWCRLATDLVEHDGKKMIMVGLTYRDVDGWKGGHINSFMKSVKQSLGDRLHAFAWVAEMQRRGAVHYHLVLIVDPYTRLAMPDKSGMWPHGSSNIQRVRSPWYLVTYLGKEYQKSVERFPKGCRMFAVSMRGMKPPEVATEDDVVDIADHPDKWQYIGSTVTLGYAKLLVPPDTITVER